MEMLLVKNETIALRNDARGAKIHCRSGMLWITQEEDHLDHCLTAGDSFVIDRTGTVIIEAIHDARLHFQPAVRAASAEMPAAATAMVVNAPCTP